MTLHGNDNELTVPATSITTALFERRLRFGGDYNPEQWPRAVWEEDIALMTEAGVNLVTVGVFSWSQLEPEEGKFTFDWLKEILDLLGDANIGVDLSTPTASPPPWLAARYPEVLPVDDRGARYWPGSRQHFCVCNPDYRRLAARIVERLVAEVGNHESVEMWHIHNEYACHVPYCYCDDHAAGFRTWLEDRYGAIGELNQAWGTAFWSQRYGQFAEVLPPRRTPTTINPTQELDYRRFTNDAFLDEMKMERSIIRTARPELPITTNFMGFFKPLDYFVWAKELDVVSTDNYQDPSDPRYPMISAMHFDLVRSLNKAAPWLVMEQVTSHVNWREHNVAKVPGAMRALSYQAVARGATGVLFFQWRASKAGGEKFHGAMLGHAGTASPVWTAVAALGRELAALGPLAGAAVQSRVAICFSWASWWALEGPGKPANDFRLVDQLTWLYSPLFDAGETADFCAPDESLDGYEVVILGGTYLMSEAEGANVVAYVEGGGTAVISYWNGIVDERDQVHLGPYGGPVRGLFGGDVVEVAPLATDDEVELEWSDGSRTAGRFWLDVIAEGDGEVLARVAAGPYRGRPAVMLANRGTGRAIYVGTRLDAVGIARLYAFIFGRDVSEAASSANSTVERVIRRRGESRYEFLINHSALDAVIDVEAGGRNLFDDSVVSSPVTLPTQGVAIVRFGP
jgi:beta-galactosidase